MGTRKLRSFGLVSAGIVAGVLGGVILVKVVGAVIQEVHIPGALPIVSAAILLAVAAALASVVPLARFLVTTIPYFQALVHPLPPPLPRPQGRDSVTFGVRLVITAQG